MATGGGAGRAPPEELQRQWPPGGLDLVQSRLKGEVPDVGVIHDHKLQHSPVAEDRLAKRREERLQLGHECSLRLWFHTSHCFRPDQATAPEPESKLPCTGEPNIDNRVVRRQMSTTCGHSPLRKAQQLPHLPYTRRRASGDGSGVTRPLPRLRLRLHELLHEHLVKGEG